MYKLFKSILKECLIIESVKTFLRSSAYKRGFKKHKHNKNLINALKIFLKHLKNSTSLPPEFNDHMLSNGVLKGKRTAHLQGQQIVILYEIIGNSIKLLGLGSHTEIGTQK